ncbi:MAG: HigA family addiction module antidote protein [Spirochaetaceae bacterium]|jgi:addiction module HigA family antidote|nr:HigA family addiction module antidote protein [Spirochaetaceae bacterium]
MKKQTILLPGSVLKESFLDAYQISVTKLSEDIGLSPSAIRQIISGKLKISTVNALKLAKYFDSPVQYWIDLQNQYDLAELEKDAELNEILKKIPKAKKAPLKAANKPAAEKKGVAPKAGDKKTAVKKAASPKAAKAPKAAKKPAAAKEPKEPASNN